MLLTFSNTIKNNSLLLLKLTLYIIVLLDIKDFFTFVNSFYSKFAQKFIFCEKFSRLLFYFFSTADTVAFNIQRHNGVVNAQP